MKDILQNLTLLGVAALLGGDRFHEHAEPREHVLLLALSLGRARCSGRQVAEHGSFRSGPQRRDGPSDRLWRYVGELIVVLVLDEHGRDAEAYRSRFDPHIVTIVDRAQDLTDTSGRRQ